MFLKEVPTLSPDSAQEYAKAGHRHLAECGLLLQGLRMYASEFFVRSVSTCNH